MWFGIYSMKKIGGGRKMFLTRANSTNWFSSCSTPSQPLFKSLLRGENSCLTMATGGTNPSATKNKDRHGKMPFFCLVWVNVRGVSKLNGCSIEFLDILQCYILCAVQTSCSRFSSKFAEIAKNIKTNIFFHKFIMGIIKWFFS